jgi:nicotinamide N-methyltransferase
MFSESDDDSEFPVDMFKEPEGFRPPSPTETFHKFALKNGTELTISLIGNHSLWAHCLWNAGVYLAKYIDSNPELVKGKRVLEFGAAAALPSLCSALNGAEKVVITDHPDQVLVDMLNENAKRYCIATYLRNIPKRTLDSVVSVFGFLWGDETSQLMKVSPDGYDIIIMRYFF